MFAASLFKNQRKRKKSKVKVEQSEVNSPFREKRDDMKHTGFFNPAEAER